MVVMRPPHRWPPKPPPVILGITALDQVARIQRPRSAAIAPQVADVENADSQRPKPPPRKFFLAAAAGTRSRAMRHAEARLSLAGYATSLGPGMPFPPAEAAALEALARQHNDRLLGRRRRRKRRVDAVVVPAAVAAPVLAPTRQRAPEARAPPPRPRSKSLASRVSQSKPARVSSQSARVKDAPPPRPATAVGSRVKEAAPPRPAVKKCPSSAPPPPPLETATGRAAAMALPGGGTNTRYWERVADEYDEEIMDTLTEDTGKVLRKRVRDCCRKLRRAKSTLTALDAGCGAGKWLTFLGSVADDLLAIDCAPKLVERAKIAYGPPGSVTTTGRPRARCRFAVVDLTQDVPGEVYRHDLVVSANVLIAPDRVVCEAILAATLKRVERGGFLVLLVPSHESARAVANAYMRHRLPKKKLGRSERHRDFTPLNAPDVEAMVWKRWSVRTQTYSLAALRGMLDVEGYEVERVQRVDYAWDTEIDDVRIPKKATRPYDWLAVVRRLV